MVEGPFKLSLLEHFSSLQVFCRIVAFIRERFGRQESLQRTAQEFTDQDVGCRTRSTRLDCKDQSPFTLLPQVLVADVHEQSVLL